MKTLGLCALPKLCRGILSYVTAMTMTFLAACSNNPYPDRDSAQKILYTSFDEPPKTLDPAVAYSTTDHAITGNVFDTLLEYHYLKRPYTLIPGLAVRIPEPAPLEGGRVAYRFELRPGVLYQNDPCFAASSAGHETRTVDAADVAFALARIADPAVNSPVGENFRKIEGFDVFIDRLKRLREDAQVASLPPHELYSRAGGIDGVRVLSPTEFEIVLSEPYPQILYWFTMPFTAPLPWEAVAYYDGSDGRDLLADHPVGAGPFRLALYQKRGRIVLARNENWYGLRHPEWAAPGATFPAEGESEDAANGLLAPHLAGARLAFLERIEMVRDAETIPSFIKFMQGYYDTSPLIRESFDSVIRKGDLSDEMRRLGMGLEKSVRPGVYYLGFNMDDPVVGTPAGARGRALRQAMSLAIDAREFTRLFTNGRGIPAESPLPPGIFGYDETYRNPFRQVNLERATALLGEAGYPHGIDPQTQSPLHLTFDVNDTSARGLLQFQFYVDAWKGLGLQVEIAATNYNQFQEKVRTGAYQIFFWGWVADYPDPENFLFLLHGPMGRTHSGGPNTANFSDLEYDELFRSMRVRANDAERLATIRRMLAILERERPWIELFYPEDYALYHGWLKNVKAPGLSIPTAKYYDVDPQMRARVRRERNRPVLWPAFVLALVALAAVAPAVARVRRERKK